MVIISIIIMNLTVTRTWRPEWDDWGGHSTFWEWGCSAPSAKIGAKQQIFFVEVWYKHEVIETGLKDFF